MSKTILVCNVKGGSGKSLVCDEVCFKLTAMGVPYSFFDLDGQGGVIHQTKEDPNAEVIIIDTPGALQPDMYQLLESADLVVIPTKLTGRDVKPLQMMMDIVDKRANCPVLYVLNGYNQRYKAGNAFKEYFESLGDLDYLVLPQSEYFAQAATLECSVMDVAGKGSYVALMTNSLVDGILRRVGLTEEKC